MSGWISTEKLRFYGKILQNICKNHRPKLIEIDPFIKAFSLEPGVIEKWQTLFRLSPSSPPAPLTYYLKAIESAEATMNILAQYDLSFMRFFHVKSSIWINKNYYEAILENKYWGRITVSDIFSVSKNRISIILHGSICNSQNQPIFDLKNGFLIKDMHPQDCALFDKIPRYHKHSSELFKKLAKKEAVLLKEPGIHSIEIYIPKNMGKLYGSLSGDFNPLHTNYLVARLLERTNPFIQGFCIFNLVIAELFKNKGGNLSKINITFCNKIYEDQIIRLLENGKIYELVDKNNQLLAFGRYHQYP